MSNIKPCNHTACKTTPTYLNFATDHQVRIAYVHLVADVIDGDTQQVQADKLLGNLRANASCVWTHHVCEHIMCVNTSCVWTQCVWTQCVWTQCVWTQYVCECIMCVNALCLGMNGVHVCLTYMDPCIFEHNHIHTHTHTHRFVGPHPFMLRLHVACMRTSHNMTMHAYVT